MLLGPLPLVFSDVCGNAMESTLVDGWWYDYLLKMVPFRWHFWLPKRIGPAMLTEGGKSWYHLMISPADAKLTNTWLPNKPRNLCNGIMPGNFHKSPPNKNSTLNIFAPDVIHCRKMWIHLDNSIRIQEMHDTNLAMVRFLFSHLSVQ